MELLLQESIEHTAIGIAKRPHDGALASENAASWNCIGSHLDGPYAEDIRRLGLWIQRRVLSSPPDKHTYQL